MNININITTGIIIRTNTGTTINTSTRTQECSEGIASLEGTGPDLIGVVRTLSRGLFRDLKPQYVLFVGTQLRLQVAKDAVANKGRELPTNLEYFFDTIDEADAFLQRRGKYTSLLLNQSLSGTDRVTDSVLGIVFFYLKMLDLKKLYSCNAQVPDEDQ